MNYLTNYYKNLSEKLQHRVNLLENQAKMINEAVSTMSVYNRPDSTNAFGGSGVPGDYNGDGVVDGYDLGIALGNYGQPGFDYQSTLQNWTQTPGGAVSFRSAGGRGNQAGRAGLGGDRGQFTQSRPTSRGGITNVVYSSGWEGEAGGGGGGGGGGIPGDYNGDGRVDGADLGIALGNYGQQGYDFNTTLQNWTGSGMGGGSERPGFRSPRPSNTRKPTYSGK